MGSCVIRQALQLQALMEAGLRAIGIAQGFSQARRSTALPSQRSVIMWTHQTVQGQIPSQQAPGVADAHAMCCSLQAQVSFLARQVYWDTLILPGLPHHKLMHARSAMRRLPACAWVTWSTAPRR